MNSSEVSLSKKKKKKSDFQICGSRGESQYGGFRQKGTLVAQDI